MKAIPVLVFLALSLGHAVAKDDAKAAVPADEPSAAASGEAAAAKPQAKDAKDKPRMKTVEEVWGPSTRKKSKEIDDVLRRLNW